MRTKRTIITVSGFIGGLAVVTLNQARAIEPPPDDAEPPAALFNNTRNSPKPRLQEGSEPKSEQNIPFIGLATAAIPDMVSDHLNIELGSGVIVRTVSPGSPAETAGISVNDIILSIGDTAVGNPEALSSAIHERRPGDRIAVSLIHQGRPAKVEVTLIRRPSDLISGVGQELMLEGLPQAHADRLRDLIERHLEGRDQNRGMGLRIFPEQFQDQLPDIRYPGGLEVPQDQLGDPNENSFQQSSTIRVMDNEGSIEMRATNGATEVTVRDENNQTVWSGPWDSQEDKSSVPESIRERIESVQLGNGFKFSFGKPQGASPDTQDN